jgi:hypothetical protein
MTSSLAFLSDNNYGFCMTPRPATGQTPQRSIRIPNNIWEALERIANEQATTPSAVVVTALRNYVRNQK